MDPVHICKPDVLLIQPPVYDFALYDLFLEPYGLMRLAAWFRGGGYRIHTVDALDWQDPESAAVIGQPKRKSNGTGKFFRLPAELPQGIKTIERQYSRYGILPEILEQRIRRAGEQTDLVCITTGMTYWYPGAVEAAHLVRRLLPKARIIIGGIYASLMPQHAADSTGADLVVTGDAASSLKQFLSAEGFPVPSGPIPPYPDPVPFSLLDDSRKSAEAAAVQKKPIADRQYQSAVVRLNSGCPMHCDYCASDILQPEFTAGDAVQAFRYVKSLYENFGTSHIAFYDDALLVRGETVFKPFLKEVIKADLPLAFYTPNAVHIRYIDEETARLMKQAGFCEVRMGFESASAEFHTLHDRKFTASEFTRTLAVLHRAGFSYKELPVYILAGLPGQTAAEVEDSIKEAASAGASVSIAEFSPVPGTSMWEETLRASGLPLADEPLYHNNIFFPGGWEKQTREDLKRLKQLARASRE